MQELTKYAEALNVGKLDEVRQFEESFVGNDVFAQDAKTLKDAMSAGEDYSKVLGKIRKNKEQAIKSTTGFKGALKGLGGVVKTVGASLLQMGVSLAVNWAVDKVADWADQQINAVKYAKEALEDYSAKWGELQEQQSAAGDLVTKYEEDYERLSRGVNMVTGANISLSEDEYELFQQINAELADSALASVEGITVAYDAQGRAIVRLSAQMDSLSDAYANLEQQQVTEIINDMPGVLQNVTKILSTNKWKADNHNPVAVLELLEELRDIFSDEDPKDKYYNSWVPDHDLSARAYIFAETMGLPNASEFVNKLDTEPEAAQRMVTSAIAVTEKEIDDLLATARTGAQAIFKSTLSSDVADELSALARSYIMALPSTYFKDALTTDIITDMEAFAAQLSEPGFNSAVENLSSLQTDFASNSLTYGEYLAGTASGLDTFLNSTLPDEFKQLVEDAYSPGNMPYAAAVSRLMGSVTDATTNWVESLTADQLNFAFGLPFNLSSMDMETYNNLYNDSVRMAGYSNIAPDLTALKEAQTIVAEITEDANGLATVTEDQYKKLTEAGTEYAACVKGVEGFRYLDTNAWNEVIAAQKEENKAMIASAKAFQLSKYGENINSIRQYQEDLANTAETETGTREAIQSVIAALQEENEQIQTNLASYYLMELQMADVATPAEDYTEFLTAQSTLDEIIKAQGYSASITVEQYEKLVEAGEEYAACVKNVNGYLQLDAQATQSLVAAKQAEAKAQAEAGKIYEMQRYAANAREIEEYRRALEALNEGEDGMRIILEDKMNALEAEQDLIRANIDSYNVLASQIEYATSAYKKWLDAQEGPEAGDAYNNMLTAMGQIQEGQENGKIGTAKYKAAVELLVPDGREVSAYMETLERYLTEDSTGLQNFVDDMYANAFLTQDANGRFSFMRGVTVEQIARGLGLTDEVAQYMLQALQDYGWDVDLLDSQHTAMESMQRYDAAVANRQAAEAALAEAQANENATEAELAAAQAEVEQARAAEEAALAQLSAAATANVAAEDRPSVMVTVEPDDQVTTYLEALQNSEHTVEVNIVPSAESQAALEEVAEASQEITGTALESTERQTALDAAYAAMQEYRDKVDSIKAANAELWDSYSNALINSMVMENLAAMFPGIQTYQDQKDTSADQVAALEAELDAAYADAVVALAPLSSAAQAAISAAESAGASSADLVRLQGTLETLDAYYNELVDRSNNESASVSITANTNPLIDGVDSAIQQIEAKSATVTVKTQFEGAPLSGSTFFGGPALAEGTTYAPEEDALVGENGVETVISDGHFYTVGHNGPEIVHLNEGDQVLNNKSTRKLFGGIRRKAGRAYDTGRGGSSAGILTGLVSGAITLTNVLTSLTGGGYNLGGSTTGGDETPSGPSGPDYNAILDKFEKLYDWIERALEVAQKKTKDLMDQVKEFVGYIAQNNQVDKALEATRQEIELNQQAYVRYMQQAAEVQDKLDLSDDIVQKIHEGAIDIESYDETTQKKISEYQEWYKKAESVKQTLEELQDQERDLQKQRLDNIIGDYNNRLDQLDDDSARIQREIEYQQAVGIEVQESSYDDLIETEQQKLIELQSERAALEAEFNELVATGVLQVGSDDWHKYRNEIEGVDEAIHDALVSAQEFADEIYNLNLTKLQNLNTILQNIQSSTEGIMSLHDAQGTKNVAEYYETLILNGHDQIANLEEQNELIREQMEGLDTDSEKYQELLSQLVSNEEAINSIKVSQEQWNDSIADLKIDALNEERKALEKANDAYQDQLDLEEALEALAKAKSQRTKLVYREGVGFVYEADQEAIDEAQKRVDELMYQAQLDAIDDEIDAIEENKENDNVWSYDGSTLLKSGEIVPDVVYDAINEMLSAVLPDEVYAQTAVADALQTAPAVTSVGTISIGDIYVSGVDDVETLARDIVSNLPNAVLQEMHKS